MYRKEYTQSELDMQAKVREAYPFLVERDRSEGAKKISGPALAGKNIRILLKREFPGTKFSVKCDIYSMGSSIYIYWEQDDGAPGYDDVNSLVDAIFSSKRFDGMTDSTTYDADPWRQAFRALFGSAGYVACQPRQLTPEDIAGREAAKLSKATIKAPASRRRSRL